MLYRLEFRGELAPGVTPDDAAERLGRVFRQPEDAVHKRLFTGCEVHVKTVDSEAQAQRYIDTFAKGGVILELRRVAHGLAATSRKRFRRRFRRLAGAAFLAAVLIAAAWYLAPVWQNATV